MSMIIGGFGAPGGVGWGGVAKSRLTLVSDWGAGGSQGSGKGDFLLRNLLSNLMFLELFLVQERGTPLGGGIIYYYLLVWSPLTHRPLGLVTQGLLTYMKKHRVSIRKDC